MVESNLPWIHNSIIFSGKYCLEGSNSTSGDCFPGYYCSGGAKRPDPYFEGVDPSNPGMCWPIQPRYVRHQWWQLNEIDSRHWNEQVRWRAKWKTTFVHWVSLKLLAHTGTLFNSVSGNSICPPGYYCTGPDPPRKCPAGRYNPNNGSRTLSDCLPCPPGRYCNQSALTEAMTAPECDAGWVWFFACFKLETEFLENLLFRKHRTFFFDAKQPHSVKPRNAANLIFLTAAFATSCE